MMPWCCAFVCVVAAFFVVFFAELLLLVVVVVFVVALSLCCCCRFDALFAVGAWFFVCLGPVFVMPCCCAFVLRWSYRYC